MAGNVFEWSSSDYEYGRRKVLRGGSCGFGARYCRAAVRDGVRLVNRLNGIGFRVVVEVAEDLLANC
jgi:formylglycine-generating enzyme required for sulfatase activity